MCIMCTGASHTQVIDHHVRLIDEHGWTITGVTGPLPWTYTIGLTWHLEHPELIVIGMEPTSAAGVLHRVVDRIRAGTALTVGTSLAMVGGDLGFGAVDPRNLLGEWFAQWHPIARASDHAGASLRALQVRLPGPDDRSFCAEQRALERRCTVDALSRRRARTQEPPVW